MRSALPFGACIVLCTSLLIAGPVDSPDQSIDLDFEARVRAQESIERVYHRHRIDSTAEFEITVSTRVLETKVHRFFRQSRALEQHWQISVTAHMLDRELQRMVRETNDAERLWELFAALDNDPILIQECLARPILVDRLLRNFYAADDALHSEATVNGVPDPEIWWDEFEATPVRTVADADTALPAPRDEEDCVPGAWKTDIPSPSPRSGHVAVWTGAEMLVWGGGYGAVVGGRYDPATDSWSAMTTLGAPGLRNEATAVWTGSEMIVWGGNGVFPEPYFLNTGGRYDPATDTWSPVTTQGAPTGRSDTSAVWTGHEMIVWGGFVATTGSDRYTASGGRYDPSTDTWTPTSMVDAPRDRAWHSTIWTGTELIIWGGRHDAPYATDTGGRYDPTTDTWTPTTTVDAPTAREGHEVIWTGDEMIVWGGSVAFQVHTNTGGRYDPMADSWTATSTGPGVPTAREVHTVAWTGSEMLVWGGQASGSGPLADGGRYDPVADSWSGVADQNEPVARYDHTMVWTGNLAIVWGGRGTDEPLGSGSRYSPATDTWTPTTSSVLWGGEITKMAAVWTGNEMIVWGGSEDNAGIIYTPATGARTATTLLGAPEGRSAHTAVWTGSEMIVWGGQYFSYPAYVYLNSGGRYNPATDSWTATSVVNGVPTPRRDHTAVWTDAEMIVWGGGTGDPSYETGARYDPATDSWVPMSTIGAPERRRHHTAVWTGNEMIVWGGQRIDGSSYDLNSGGQYDPLTDTWFATSDVGAPTRRQRHTALWTGNEMVVWGGAGDSTSLASGARYNPVSRAWKPTATLGAPIGRVEHTAVWTGPRMVVWGGKHLGEDLADGGSYDLLLDSWIPTASENAPTARDNHVAVWTGDEMIVWGGRDVYDDDPHPNFIEAAIYTIPDIDADGFCAPEDCDDLNSTCTTDCTDNDQDGFCVTADCDESNPNCAADCTDADDDGFCVNVDCDDSTPYCTDLCTDADSDGYCVPVDCDESNPYCTADCTDDDDDGYCIGVDCDDLNPNCSDACHDADNDGFCTTHDCDDNNSHCTTDCADQDGDEYCVTDDCDDANANCTLDCTDFDEDGFCIEADCDDSNSACTGLDCTDADGDGVRVCENDCDDLAPYCTTDCTDSDHDGFCITTDCDESNPYCTSDCTDADSDWFCVTTDCDESNPNCTYDCTDTDGDEFCISTDCDDADPDCTGIDCSDADGDTVRVCEDDCDDLNPNCTSDCTDSDSDGFCVTIDCDESNPNCTSDCTDADADGYCATSDCDDSDPDCSLDCSDSDGDGLAACRGDCDDDDPAVRPGLPEVCTDNADNDCNGLTDAEDAACLGLVVSELQFMGKESLHWTGSATAGSYGLYRGTISTTGMLGYDHLCEATELVLPETSDLDLPRPNRGFYYLVAGQVVDIDGDRFTGGPLGVSSNGASRPTSETITCGPRVYVDPDVILENGDGLTWATAYSSVSLALDHPAYRNRGSEVWIRGTVSETGAYLPMVLRPGVRLLGGFDGTETASWERSPETSPTVWSGSGGLLLFRASGSSVVLDGLTLRDALSGFVGDPAGRLTEITDVTVEQIGGYGVNLRVQSPGNSELVVRDSSFDSAGLGAIEVVAVEGRLTGEIRDNAFKNWTETALKLEARPQSSAEVRLDVISNRISGGGDGIVLGAHLDDRAGPAIQSSFIGSNLIHSTTGRALAVEASGFFDFEDGPAVVEASPLIVGNTFVDAGDDGIACVAERNDLTSVPHLHTVRATPQLWDNLITHNYGAGISETPDDPGTNLTADPVIVGNGLHGNSPLYRNEGTTDLTLIDDVNALENARDNFDDDPRYRDRAAQDYGLAFGTVLGFKSRMRYLANATDSGLGMLWTQPGFDASSWQAGIYGVGFDIEPGINATALLQTKVSPASISVYTLVPFTVDDLSAISNLILGADYDDGFAIWLNGTELFRSESMSAGTLEWNSMVAPHESSNGRTPTYEEYDISTAGVPALIEGENLLAVAVWTRPGSTDLVLVPRLILQQESPAVDAGHLEAPRLAAEDVDGDSRVNDSDRDGLSGPDVGADERW